MGNAVSLTKETLKSIYPGGIYFLYEAAAIIFLLVRHRTKQEKLLGRYAAVVLLTFLFPPFAYAVSRFMREGDVYWRYLWLLPAAVLLAYTAVTVIWSAKTKAGNILLALLTGAVLILGGRNLYAGGAFTKAFSREKLPEMTMITADRIEKNIEETGNSYAYLAAPLLVSSEIREVTSAVTLFTGRVMDFSSIQAANKGWYRNLMVLNNQWTDEEHKAVRSLKKQRCNYILLYDRAGSNGYLKKAGYHILFDGGTWKLWFHPDVKPKT